jgi:hypothetical protein
MKNYRVLLIVIVLLALLNLIGLLKSSQVVAQNQNQNADPVRIISPLPLPITGTSTVSGTVGATQSGNWNVGILGQPIGVNVNNPLTVFLPTHLGVLPSSIVKLTTKLGTTCMPLRSFCQIKPDGTFVTTPFVIPADKYLVITDVAIATAGQTPNSFFTVELVIGAPGSQQTIYFLEAPINANGEGFASDHLTSGIVASTMPTEDPFAGVNISGYLVAKQ